MVMSSIPSDVPNDVGPRVTDRQWELYRSQVHQLYVTEGCTAEQVREIMEERYDFKATVRMYKGRFKTWGMASKNVKAIEYEAMKMVHDEIFASEGVEVCFSALRGRVRKMHRIADVRKELARPGSKRKREQHRKEIMERGLDQVLERKDIRIIRPEQSVPPESDDGSPLSTGSRSMSLESDSDPDLFTAGEPADMISKSFETRTISLYTPQTHGQPSDSAEVADVDLDAAFRALSTDYWELMQPPQYDRQPSFLLQQPDAMRDTELWALHLFETAIKTDEKRQDDAAGFQRKCACDVFERMLTTANPHILSSLIHISCVFLGIGGVYNYRSILADCWDLISENLRINPTSASQTYAIPYRYALACETGEDALIFELGAQLLNGTEQYGYDGHTMSSNFLVCQQFRAHHLLEHMQDAAGARDILLRCLYDSARCLKLNHSVNVSCLYLLARAYERLGQIQSAIDAYLDAAQRSVEIFGRRHPYRMVLVRQLAMLQATLGMTYEAEQNHLEAFWCRNEILGPGHAYTESSSQALQQLWICHGRREDAVEQESRRLALYREEKHWKILSKKDADTIRRQGRNTGVYWEKADGLFKYEFVMPREAYMRVGPPSNTAFARL